MSRLLFATVASLLILFPVAAVAEPLPILSVSGAVTKANDELVIIRPRGPDGKFGPAVTLKVRGTTYVTTLTSREARGKLVPVRKETKVKDLLPEQIIVALSTVADKDQVLLSAVVQPAASK